MASATTSNKLSLLKRLWGSKVAEPMYKKCKFANMVKKDTKFGGEGKYVIIALTSSAGGATNFTDALATQGASKEMRFFVTHKKEYVVWSLQRDVIKRSMGDANAVMEVLKRELEAARKKFDIRFAKRIYGKHGGSIARMSTYSTTTATIANRSDMAAFEKDNQYGFASDDGSAASPAGLRNSGSVPVYRTVASVNRRASTVTFTETLATVPAITTTDYVFWRGDYADVMTGLRGWNPESDPSASESFFGYDRTTEDMQRVSGIRVAAAATMLETIEDAAAELSLHGVSGENMALLINPLDCAKLFKEMGSNRVEYEVSATVGFKAVKIATMVGEVSVISETWVPQGYGWIVDAGQITVRTAGDLPDDLTDDAGGLLIDHSDDAKQGRIGGYGNIFFDNPGENAIITWPS